MPMVKRRDRRAALSSARREVDTDAPKQVNKASDSSAGANRKLFLIFIFIFFFVVVPAVSILVYKLDKGSGHAPRAGEEAISKTDINYRDILNENSKVSGNGPHRNYKYPVLGYITPWNSKGYEIAKQFAHKFTHLSPVWYDLKSQGAGLILEGRHNVDREWILELRKRGDALVLPRVVLEAFPRALLGKKKLRDKAIDLIVSECKEMEYDGIVLESWSRWAAFGVLHDHEMRNKALQFIEQLGHALHSVSSPRNSKESLQLIYVIGPPYSRKLESHEFGPEDLRSLSDAVDGFSLMTYDFSGPQNPGPNAPLKWIRFVLQLLLAPMDTGDRGLADKIFLGLNFYGNDFRLPEGSGGEAIMGRDYLTLLEEHKPKLQWENNSGEHFFLYADYENVKHAVFYPSLTSISQRLEEAREWGAGISIWEIGQGLDYFFDLL